MRFSNWAVALVVALSAGCGDSSAAGGAGAGGGSGEGGGASPGACDPDTLCLDIVEEGAIPDASRFAIVWFRLEGAVAADPTVALDLAFDASSTYAEVNLSDIALPPDLDKLCERACAEPIDCPACTGEFEAAVAYVMVVADADMSGSIEPAEVAEPDNVVGIANTAVAWSNTTTTNVAPPFDEQFPNGTVEGLAAYRINAGGAFELASEGSVYQLKIGPDVF